MSEEAESSAGHNAPPITEQVERWCRATDRLLSPAPAAVEAGHEARRAAFARVMHEALGSLLLNGSSETLHEREDRADKNKK